MLDQDADEALESAKNGAVQHHRTVLFAVFADVTGVQTLGQHAVRLDRADLPSAADRVGQVEFELGRVERAFARQFFPAEFFGRAAGFPHRVAQLLLGLVPHFVGAEALLGAQRELDRVFVEPEIVVDAVEQVAEVAHLAHQLVLAHEDVRVVLSELAHAHDAVERAVRLVPVAAAELRHAQAAGRGSW